MGDTNTVDMGTAVHEGILKEADVLKVNNQLRYGFPLPSCSLKIGVYIDDLLVLLDVSRDKAKSPDRDTEAAHKASQGYVDAGVPESTRKAFTAELDFSSWGAEVKGGKGCVGSPLSFRRQLWALSSLVLRIGWATKLTMQKMLGYYAVAWSFCRPLYGIFHGIYVWVDALGDGRWYKIPPNIAEELNAAAVHLAVAVVDLRAQISKKVWATDATPSHAGVTVAVVDDVLVDLLYRGSERRGAHVRLDQEACCELDRLLKPVKELENIVESFPWKTTHSYAFHIKAHINLQEARTIRNLIRELAGVATVPTRYVLLCDSSVCVGAFSKGRSSSRKLNGLLRAMIGHLVCSGISLSILWISTGKNPADHPSRNRPLPPPKSPPTWIAHLVSQCSFVGREFFAGVGAITNAFRAEGFPMDKPFDVKMDSHDDMLNDAMFEALLKWLDGCPVRWIWLAPPCTSFSALQNGHREGRWRSREHPEGFGRCEVVEGNVLWNRTLVLAKRALELGIDFAVEHPMTSYAWGMDSTKALLNDKRVSLSMCDLCMFAGPSSLHPHKKPLKIMTSASWVRSSLRRCDNTHTHAPHLCNTSAQKSSAYPQAFGVALAMSYAEAAPKTSHSY
jgi:hypothetical protein